MFGSTVAQKIVGVNRRQEDPLKQDPLLDKSCASHLNLDNDLDLDLSVISVYCQNFGILN